MKQNELKRELPAAIETLEALARKKEASSSRSLFKKMMSFALRLISRPKPTENTLITEKEIQRKVHTLEIEKNESCKLIEQKAILELAPLKQEIDAFRMKAISMLSRHEIRFTSFHEQLHVIREVPIVVIENTPLSKTLAENIISMQQTLTTLPGETIELKGAFKRSPQHHSQSVPIPDSFHLVTQSHQTGFPHPSQHHGWALASLLLPLNQETPVQGDKLRHEMNEMAQKLMPHGCLNQKAKEMLKLKQQAASAHRQNFFSLHKQLSRAILKVGKQDESILDPFFNNLQNVRNSYLHLSDVHQTIAAHYLEGHEIPQSNHSQEELIYMHLIGKSLQTTARHNRELLETLALKQFKEFIVELEEKEIKTIQEMYDWLRNLLESDINIWQQLTPRKNSTQRH